MKKITAAIAISSILATTPLFASTGSSAEDPTVCKIEFRLTANDNNPPYFFFNTQSVAFNVYNKENYDYGHIVALASATIQKDEQGYWTKTSKVAVVPCRTELLITATPDNIINEHGDTYSPPQDQNERIISKVTIDPQTDTLKTVLSYPQDYRMTYIGPISG
ncbi:hypothetical protein L3V83_11955 [Thiotrichales bacterium 19X7-9]|nr:hypothetical protein [Thiotrichales bacterium 19X7-9]